MTYQASTKRSMIAVPGQFLDYESAEHDQTKQNYSKNDVDDDELSTSSYSSDDREDANWDWEDETSVLMIVHVFVCVCVCVCRCTRDWPHLVFSAQCILSDKLQNRDYVLLFYL